MGLPFRQGDGLILESFKTSAIVSAGPIGGEMTDFFSMEETCGRVKAVESEVCEGVKAVEGAGLRF